MQEALTAYLLGSSGLAALVSNRITWAARPQASALPSVTLHTIDDIPGYVTTGPDGLASSRIQVDCWGLTYAEAKLASRAVEARLSGMSVTVSGVALRGGFKQGERDSFEQAAAGGDVYRTSTDYIIWHNL
jgi:hypothetical protein